MPEPTRQEMMLEKSRQTLMDLNADESVKQVARDVMLCDLHRWLEVISGESADGVDGGPQ